jgi:G3E family GTPase
MAPNTRADPFAGKIPVTVITGFLGSGKTTLLKKLLRHPDMNRAAVIINEFGEVGIDDALVEASSEQTTLLDNGCLCCVLRTDLQETLRGLFIKRRAGEVIDFDRVFIETSGMADPAPVMQTISSDTMIAAHFRLDGVVTLADAVNGADNLETLVEPVKQAAVADRILVTKGDIATPRQKARLLAGLRDINHQADIREVVQGEIDPAELTGIALRRGVAGAEDLVRWMGRLPQAGGAVAERVQGGRHTKGVEAFCLWFDLPFSWKSLTAIVQLLTTLRGPDLLRVKGLVNVEGETGPVVVQGVQHVFSEPVTLAAWADADHRSRIVFITRDLPREVVENLVKVVGAVGISPEPSGGSDPPAGESNPPAGESNPPAGGSNPPSGGPSPPESAKPPA